jgi:acetylornithine deacetylase/succinyl-diaminopimelate desuccinylase-like protein
LVLVGFLPSFGWAEPASKSGGLLAREFREAHAVRILSDYAELLAIPNVASDTVNIRRNADYLRNALAERGVEAELWTLPEAPPIVYGKVDVPGARRTIGIYVHYDGQPVDESQWSQPPWSPTLYTAAIEAGGVPRAFPQPGEAIDPEWRIYARGSGDDKVPLPAIFAALDALAAAGRQPTSNLRFLFEGEEEAGSPHLEEYLRTHNAELDADLWLICDGPVHQSRRPQLVFGVRGITRLELTVYGASRYLHSGHYGNWAPNPAMLLAQLLASMKSADGEVLVDGFYDSTASIGPEERSAMETLPDYDEELRRELGLAATEADNAPLAERLMLPSLNVRGMVSAAVGAEARNVIPTEATASIDIRLAKGNDPVEMLDLVEAHIRAQGYHIVRAAPDEATRSAHPRIARVVRKEGYPAARTPVGLPAVQPIIEAARRASPEPLVLVPTMGGSLPLYLFTEVVDRPIVIVPIANHDDNQHAPDENIRIANIWFGIELMGELFTMP